MAVPTHLVLDARFGHYKTSEMAYAKELIPSIPNDSLTIFDRGFLAAELLCNLVSQGTQRHFLVPAKSHTKWKLIDGTDDDGIVEMEVSDAAMRSDTSLPSTWRVRAIRIGDGKGGIIYLIT